MINPNLSLSQVLEVLAKKRRLFYSEKDFQLHLAWELKEHGCEVQLEYDPQCFASNAAIDILISLPKRIAVELKYKTKLLAHICDEREFALKDHAAEDQALYDFWKDVQRIETIVAKSKSTIGYAIFLTNNGSYWRNGRETSADADFRMSEGRVVSGNLAWGSRASNGTKRGHRGNRTGIELLHQMDRLRQPECSERPSAVFAFGNNEWTARTDAVVNITRMNRRIKF